MPALLDQHDRLRVRAHRLVLMRVAVDPTNGDVYVTNSVAGTVSVIDPNTNTIVGGATVGQNPDAVALDPANGDVYVLDNNDSSLLAGGGVSVIDPSTNTDIDTVTVIDPHTNAVTHNIPVGDDPDGLAFDPVNGDFYVANSGSGTVSVINPG